ncbi:apoptosis-inducing factor A [Ceratobasidium sp. AG-Ba]|nr:apoptosis-inducing factor A [Ceratobasidium sp. AG-Ba]
MSDRKNIVVVGSGGGGVPMIQSLQKQINPATHQIVVVEKRDFYAHWPSLIRASVTATGSLEENGLVPYDRAFDSSVRLVHANVTEITATTVVTETQTIAYDQLVLATGSIWNGALALPDTRSQAIEHIRSFRSSLEAVQNVLVVGGGAVGVEYVGELRHFMPDKKITLVHGGNELMNKTYPVKYRKALYNAVTKLGVHVILDDKISPTTAPEGGIVTTEKGQQIEADIVINATGGRPNTSIVRTLDPSALTATGTVQVTPELRVQLASGAQNVWAMGDIIEWPEQKMVMKASMGHAPLIAKNIAAVIKGGKVSQYSSQPEMIMVTLGPKGGRGSAPFFGGMVLGDWMVSKVKSGNLFVSKTRKNLGY